MVINKQQGSTPVTVSLANFSALRARRRPGRFNSASQTSIARLADVQCRQQHRHHRSFAEHHAVRDSGGQHTPAPSAPTGLAATVGSGTVTLTWNAGGGATSYTVKRGIASGGPYTTVASLAGSPTSFTDSGLTNGTTYYYVVTGANSAGTSPNSSELPRLHLCRRRLLLPPPLPQIR